MLRVLKSMVGWLPLHRRAQIVARLLPARHWYGTALWASGLQARMTGWMGGNRVLTEALMLDHWIRELTEYGAFPIPLRAMEVGALKRRDPHAGVLYCWTHTPLLDMPLRLLSETGYELPWAVAEPGRIAGEDEFLVPGLVTRVRAIPADRHALVRMRTVLRGGESVACMADAEMGGKLSALAMRLAGKVGARVIFQWAERQPDGVIAIWFVDAPRPRCEDQAAIEENLEYLRVANRRILGGLGVRVEESSGKVSEVRLRRRAKLSGNGYDDGHERSKSA